MKALRQFDIAFVGLKPGEHTFEYQITDSFFEDYGPQDFSNCKATVKLLLDKKNNFFLLKFEIGGTVTVNCDRCGQPFDLQLWDDFEHVVKLVNNPDELNEEDDTDVSFISLTESHLNVADWIYEFINLSIPMQRIHPADSKGQSGCDPKILDMLDQMNRQANEKENPIWKGLDKFREN
ncbi:YceD family protein [Chitinophaga pinensis]|uniref:DUF177 domain-containing protein n=1 Tax=Chitinophaga pinensis (strain ATCC 43595 / DSM 2588 / LMG 13176 / NBRC 15968 / NCIMB 11800 / UQM 2034) TaxID=485918 RepID=A0A979GAG1_CHIPD|nr:DUF177 domain-containing protein [Chitinophaga pinensis]ACU63702.1 protein of unknown function DUF177 [Chitinophaga pinensis DSM 2588]